MYSRKREKFKKRSRKREEKINKYKDYSDFELLKLLIKKRPKKLKSFILKSRHPLAVVIRERNYANKEGFQPTREIIGRDVPI